MGGIVAHAKMLEIRKIVRILGALRARTMTGTIARTTSPRTAHMGNLLRKKSFEAVDTIADWRESKTKSRLAY